MDGLMRRILDKTLSVLGEVQGNLGGQKGYYTYLTDQDDSFNKQQDEIREAHMSRYLNQPKTQMLNGYMGLGMATANDVFQAAKKAELESAADLDSEIGADPNNPK